MQSNKPTRLQVEQLENYHNARLTLTTMTLWFTVFVGENSTLKSILLIYVLGPVAHS